MVCSQPRGDNDIAGIKKELSSFRGEAEVFLKEGTFVERHWADRPKCRAFPKKVTVRFTYGRHEKGGQGRQVRLFLKKDEDAVAR